MTEDHIALPEYKPELFINREPEVKHVFDRVEALLAGIPQETRTIAFIGERGTGKSWLLKHLHYRIKSELPDIGIVLLDLLQEEPPSVAQTLLTFNEILTGKRDIPGATLPDLSRAVMQNVRQFIHGKPLIVLVDHVYEWDWKLLPGLEDYLLGPLAIETKTLIVLAGRGREYPWKTLELRFKAEFVDLQPFQSASETTEQLVRLAETPGQLDRQFLRRTDLMMAERAEEIHNISGGNPLGNFLLATNMDWAQGLDSMIEKVLEIVPSDRRLRVREYLEALSVLRSFDEERILSLLAAYHNDMTIHNWSFAQARQVREELVARTAFAHWSEEQGGYVIDRFIRSLFERYLKTAKTNQWETLHGAALRHYTKWHATYSAAKNRWQAEIDHHESILRSVGVNPELYLRTAEPTASKI